MQLGIWLQITGTNMVAAICNCTSFFQLHGLPKSHCDDNWEGTWLHDFIWYHAHLTSTRFEHSICQGPSTNLWPLILHSWLKFLRSLLFYWCQQCVEKKITLLYFARKLLQNLFAGYILLLYWIYRNLLLQNNRKYINMTIVIKVEQRSELIEQY